MVLSSYGHFFIEKTIAVSCDLGAALYCTLLLITCIWFILPNIIFSFNFHVDFFLSTIDFLYNLSILCKYHLQKHYVYAEESFFNKRNYAYNMKLYIFN